MKIGDAIVYIAFIATWICGVAAAIAKGGWVLLVGSILFPPLAWLCLAMRWIA